MTVTVTLENHQEMRALYPRLGLHTLTKGTSLRYDPENDRLVCFVTQVADTALGRDVEVGWDMCSWCHSFIDLCACIGGPSLPSYITKWNGEPPPGYEVATPAPTLTASVRDLYPEGYKAKRRDPVTGRKERRDKGTKRGPRGLKQTTEFAGTVHPGVSSEPVVTAPPAINILSGPCAMHTAESKRRPDGSYECTVPGCRGVA